MFPFIIGVCISTYWIIKKFIKTEPAKEGLKGRGRESWKSVVIKIEDFCGGKEKIDY